MIAKTKIFNLCVIALLSGLLFSCKGEENLVFETSSEIKNAMKYICENNSSVNQAMRNTYHLSAPIGWINDPNGFSEYQGKYHLFYQYNPYDAVWGPMHWGHQTTKDFIKWEHQDVALAPDVSYDKGGCFSGTALVENGIQYLAYTAVDSNQNQAMAYTKDGKTYKKLDKLLLTGADMPEGFSNSDFRDPKLFKRNGKYYMIVGNKNNITFDKQLVMFEANAVTGPYAYKGVIYSRNDLGGILECPDLVTIDGIDVLISSPQSIGSEREDLFQNVDSCVYLPGNLSVNTNKFYPSMGTQLEEFDKGFSFYAPQTMQTSDGRTMLVAWMKSWSEPNVTREDGWCGAMTLPRELTIKDNHIYQTPAREIKNYLKDKKTENSVTLTNESQVLSNFSSTKSKITVDIDVRNLASGKCGIEVFKGSKNSTKIYYDASKGYVVFDRTKCGSMLDGVRYANVEPLNGKISLEIYLDVNSIEVFINGGYYTMTGTVFSQPENVGVSLFSENCEASFSNLTKHEIIV